MGLLSLVFGKNPSLKDEAEKDSDLVVESPSTEEKPNFEKPFVDEPPIPEEDKKFYENPEYYSAFVPSFSFKAKNGMLPVQSFAERKKTSYPSPRGLYIGEIALIHYCSFGDYPNPKHKYPGFWWFEYGMKNVNFYLESLEERGFIQMQENGKYKPTELGNQEVTDNYYVVYMRNAPGMTVDNLEASDDFSVWGINRRLAGGDPRNWEDVVNQIWSEIDEYKARKKAEEDAKLKAIGVDVDKYRKKPDSSYLNWDELGFRDGLRRVSSALNIDTSYEDKLPIGYLQALMRRVLDTFLTLERSKDVSIFFDKIDLIKQDLKQLSLAELKGVKFSYSPSLLLWSVETHQKDLFRIVVENTTSAQMDKICSLKTDHGRLNSNKHWKESIDLLAENLDDELKAIIQDSFAELEKSREEMKSDA
jgi:hypothetical protein|nr:MAG TPA_asm: hypothetical protein [Caudoviricetes sp.]